MHSFARLAAFPAAALALCLGGPLAAQQTDGTRLVSALRAPVALDARLIVGQRKTAPALETDSIQAVARPRWRYPVIGAAIGVAAGLAHAHAATRGDYVGFPVEPMYFLPPAYGAAGAFIGFLVDAGDRERRARRE